MIHFMGEDVSKDYTESEGVILHRENGDSETFIFIWKRDMSSRTDRQIPWVAKARSKLHRLLGDMRSYGKIPLLQ
jgi:hypothetical protein